MANENAKRGLLMNDHKRRVYDSILGLLSNEDNPTPLVSLNRVSSFKHTQIFGKLEWYNPFGAIKDRVAANLVHDAEARGVIEPHKTNLVEPSSGNTGMGLAMIGNAKGYHLSTPLSSAIPIEKRAILRFAAKPCCGKTCAPPVRKKLLSFTPFPALLRKRVTHLSC